MRAIVRKKVVENCRGAFSWLKGARKEVRKAGEGRDAMEERHWELEKEPRGGEVCWPSSWVVLEMMTLFIGSESDFFSFVPSLRSGHNSVTSPH